MPRKYNATRSYATHQRLGDALPDSLGRRMKFWEDVSRNVPVWIEDLQGQESELFHKLTPKVDAKITLRNHDVRFGDRFVTRNKTYNVKSVVNQLSWIECLCDTEGIP